ncbi:peptidoglycan DD-metalloendopeptidase family protein [Alphaproteobacteria bacterium]|nr:peptidoglycan DD-metalloendopeptidase family protein [Alphaproteobacteria bacterium]
MSLVFPFFLIEKNFADDVDIQLKKIEKKLKEQQILQDELTKKQKKINSSMKIIERSLKTNERKVESYFSELNTIKTKILQYEKNKKKIKKDLYLLGESKKNIIKSFLKEKYSTRKNIEATNNNYTDAILFNIYKHAIYKTILNDRKIKVIDKNIIFFENNFAMIKDKLNTISKKILEKSTIETTLQGENLITSIQKKENELQSYKMNKKARELKKLIESLKNKNKGLTRKKSAHKYNFNKIENILPIRLKNIQNIRTDSSKKGILLTLKEKSFLTTPREGLVVYADSFKGYGNMIILDLGDNYHIIYSGLTNIMCSVGDWLNTGNILGEIEMKNEINEVYLEVRFKGKTIDPSNWINS